MTKILYIVSTLQRNGPINVLYNLISHLDRTRYDPVILTLSPDNPRHHSLETNFKKLEVPIHTLGLSRIQGFLQGTDHIKKFVVNEKIDVVHINGFRGDWLLRASDLPRTSIVTTINSNIYDDYTMLYGKNRGKVMASLHILSLKNKLAVGCSEFVSEQLNSRYRCDLRVIYNGIPKESYVIATPEKKKQVRKALDLPPDKRVFLFVGSLILRKDPITVIEGFIESSALKDAILLIMGDGPLMEACKQKAGNHTNIHFLGNRPETLNYLHASDYYIASSFSEGLPTSVMEAMGCGLPVILSEIDPHRELLKKMSSWSYSFPTSDSSKLAAKIDAISQDDFNTLSRKCRNVIENEINADRMASEYQKLYDL